MAARGAKRGAIALSRIYFTRPDAQRRRLGGISRKQVKGPDRILGELLHEVTKQEVTAGALWIEGRYVVRKEIMAEVITNQAFTTLYRSGPKDGTRFLCPALLRYDATLFDSILCFLLTLCSGLSLRFF